MTTFPSRPERALRSRAASLSDPWSDGWTESWPESWSGPWPEGRQRGAAIAYAVIGGALCMGLGGVLAFLASDFGAVLGKLGF
jgi:hypothetical protein